MRCPDFESPPLDSLLTPAAQRLRSVTECLSPGEECAGVRMVTPVPSIRAVLVPCCVAGAGLGLCGCAREPGARAGERPWFAEITREVGLDFVQRSGARGEYAMPEIMGGGVALLDADGDGDLDVLCVGTNGAPDPRGAREPDENARTRLFRQDAPGRFVDATDAAGLAQRGYGMGAAVGDVDNDGDEDVYVTCVGPNALFVNAGGGRFAEAAAARGAQGGGWSTSAAFFDADRDGFLELFVARYVEHDPGERCHDNAGRRDYCGPKAFPPQPDLLLQNRAGRDFEDVSGPAGIAAVRAAGLGVVCADLDDDGWQDVFVANDAFANHLWINRRDGTFGEEGLARGVALNLSGQPRAGMGVAVADLDGDARLDLFVTHLRDEANGLFANRGAAGFADLSGQSRLGPVSMPFTGFGAAALDLDRDRDVDLVVANGGVLHGPRHPGVELGAPWDTYAEPNLLHVNAGGGRFEDARGLGGELCDRVEISRGLAAGDVDGDGDPDLLLGQVEGPARLYRNDAPAEGRHWIALRCVHRGWKRDALGARIELVAGGTRQVQVLASSWSYLSSSPPVAYFGLGELAAIEHAEVLWPDGERERFPALAVDRLHVLEHGMGGE
jgi:hypothetical protein